MTETAVKEVGTDKGANTKLKRVLILGCGPAALIAAHTLEMNGVGPNSFDIISISDKQSEIKGAQFLHRPVFDLEYPETSVDPDGTISILKLGDGGGYADKVYGDTGMGTSFDRIGMTGINGRIEIDAWSLEKAYDRLWMVYRPSVNVREVTPDVFSELMDSGEYSHVISSIPPSAYCDNPIHSFPSTKIILGEPIDPLPIENAIVYSGRKIDPWYRMSSIFGFDGVEIGLSGKDNKEQALEQHARLCWTSKINTESIYGYKPMGTSCNCGFGHPKTKLLRIGRFGTWDRRVLLHQVPSQVSAVL